MVVAAAPKTVPARPPMVQRRNASARNCSAARDTTRTQEVGVVHTWTFLKWSGQDRSNRTRSRSHAASHASSTSCAATDCIAVSASSTSGGSDTHEPSLRSMNITRAAQAARLLPSGNGCSTRADTPAPRLCRMGRGRSLRRRSRPAVHATRSLRDRQRAALTNTIASRPVTCSASQKYSASEMSRVTWPVGRAAPCRARATDGHAW